MSEDAERIIGLYRRHADAWDAARRRQHGNRPLEADWLDRFLRLLPPDPTVLDIGCGSGEPIDRFLAEHGCILTGVDSAPEMIDLCTSRLPGQTWHVADMRSLALGRVFDGIVAWDSFFHLSPDDQRRMFPIFRAHAAPRAALMFTSGPDYGVAMGTFEGEPLYHASLSGTEHRALLAGNDFDVVETVVEDPSCGGHTIWLARSQAAGPLPTPPGASSRPEATAAPTYGNLQASRIAVTSVPVSVSIMEKATPLAAHPRSCSTDTKFEFACYRGGCERTALR